MKLKINSEVNHDLNYWLGRDIVCQIIITDVNGQKYESEIYLPKKWNYGMFTDALKNSFLMCDDTPETILINYIGPDLEIMN